MTNGWIFRLLFVSSLFCVSLFSAELTDPQFEKELDQGVNAILAQKYDSAETMANRMIKKAPKSPAGYFLKATTLVASYYDKTDTTRLKEFYAITNRIVALTENRREPIMQLYRGAAFAYSSIMLAKEGKWISGARTGKKSSDIFKAMIKKGVESADALGMLGSYHYWTSAFIARFSWLSFIKDRREEGIAEMTIALRKARYLKFALYNSLLWVYYDHGRLESALALCDDALRLYPGHRIFLQARMHVLYKMGKYLEARDLAIRLMQEWKGLEVIPVNYNNVKIKLAIIYYTQKRKDLAEPLARELLPLKNDPYLKTRLEKEFGYLEEARANAKQ